MAKLDDFQKDLLQQAKDVEANTKELKAQINKYENKYKTRNLPTQYSIKASKILEMLNELLSDEMFTETIKVSMGSGADGYMAKLNKIASYLRVIENSDEIDPDY